MFRASVPFKATCCIVSVDPCVSCDFWSFRPRERSEIVSWKLLVVCDMWIFREYQTEGDQVNVKVTAEVFSLTM